MHGKISIFTDGDDDVSSEDFVMHARASAIGVEKYVDYDAWRNEWVCRTKQELIETLQRILKTLKETKTH